MSLRERFVNFVVRVFLRVSCKLDVQELNRMPLKGPAIFISNHTSNIEGPLYYVFLRPRKTIALAKKELWDKPFTRLAMNAWNSIPVERGGFDMKSMRSCFSVLGEGNILCIAPEGTRSRDGVLQRGMPGTTFFASRESVPIYPMVQWGLGDLSTNLRRWRRTEVHVRVGDPFLVGKTGGGRLSADERQAMADEMMYRLAALLPEHLRGCYADLSKMGWEYVKPLES